MMLSWSVVPIADASASVSAEGQASVLHASGCNGRGKVGQDELAVLVRAAPSSAHQAQRDSGQQYSKGSR